MFVDVAINVPLRRLFTYAVPDRLKNRVEPGSRVLVPFGRRERIGFCLTVRADKAAEREVKEIIALPDGGSSLLDNDYCAWLVFAADYYWAPIGQVVAQAVPPFFWDVRRLKSGTEPRSRQITLSSDFKTKDVTLTEKQTRVYEAIAGNRGRFYPALIHGVTGSGKTEVYIHLIKDVLAQKKSALFLVPEIGLTPQMLSRLSHHFKGSLLVYHSGLTQNQRLNQWRRCLEGLPCVMVGTRSALFAPLKNLGLIIVDEEQDHSYKQEDRFRYHARDLAVARARGLGIPVVMGSATPSLETYYLARKGKYHYFRLEDRIGTARLPGMRLVDFGREREQGASALFVSQAIHDAIDHFYKKRRQMILFVGQRGFAQNAFCVACHEIQLCPNCSVGLTFHKSKNELKCHYCGWQRGFDEVCQLCQKKALTLLGFGTQSVEEEIRSMHPKLKVARVDSDVANTPQKVAKIFDAFAKNRLNLMIGTQMIAKGHDFSNVGFVGILGVDAHLGLPDFRASERSFQTLVQVAGRAGRAQRAGHVIVQSFCPSHGAIALGLKHDYVGFAARELELREALGYPPFSRLVQIRFLANQQDRLVDFLRTWEVFLNWLTRRTVADEFKILGPAPMPIVKIRGKYRYHVLFKIRRGLKIKEMLAYVTRDLEGRRLKGIQIQVDVDPVNLL